jgi:hypothetical protein
MNTLHMPLICSSCKCVTTRSIFLHAPTHHTWYSSACSSFIQWEMNALLFTQEIMNLLLCVPKQEMKPDRSANPMCMKPPRSCSWSIVHVEVTEEIFSYISPFPSVSTVGTLLHSIHNTGCQVALPYRHTVIHSIHNTGCQVALPYRHTVLHSIHNTGCQVALPYRKLLKNVIRKNAFRILNSFSLSHMNDQWCTKIIIDKTQHLKEKNWRKET